jgi:hypothetical protein
MTAYDSIMLNPLGREGRPRSRSAFGDFVRAISLWHALLAMPVLHGTPLEGLTTPIAKMVLKGMENDLPPKQPKNAKYIANADHGTLALPAHVVEKVVAYCDSVGSLAQQRNALLLVLQFCQTRRIGEVLAMREALLTDLGTGNGFDWVVVKMKNKQNEQSVIPIVEVTDSGLRVGSRLREFLKVAPKDGGLLFRSTEPRLGGSSALDQTWGPMYKLKRVYDAFGGASLQQVLAAVSLSAWNDTLKQLIATVSASSVDARLYSSHSLRAGGVTSAHAAGASLEQLAGMCLHRRLDSTKGYIKPTRDTRRAAFARTLPGQ